MHQPFEIKYNDDDLQFPTHVFDRMVLEWLKNLPGDIDCMKIFKIQCLHREWVERTHDLRLFKIHSPQRKGLTGTRKVGK